jgi:hypothetical protein
MKIVTTIATILTITGCAPTMPQDAAQSGLTNLPPVSALTGQTSNLGNMGTAAAMARSLAGGSSSAGQTPALVGLLVQQLGVSPQQATGGAGSIFSLAQQTMSPNNFGQVSNAVPGMSQLLSAAPSMTGYGGGLMGSAANALGGGSSLGNMAKMAMLANSFQNLGLNSGMVSRFIPVILQYVQTQGGVSTMGLLQSAIMP